MQSSLFYDIPVNPGNKELVKSIENFANNSEMDTFLFRVPKSDIDDSSYIHDNCFLLMSPGYKIALVNGGVEDDEYNEYIEDVKEILNYLYSKYEYRNELGRFNKWGTNLLIEINDAHALDNLEQFWNKLKIDNQLEKRYSEILVSLCTGSINDIKKVKASLPVTLLDQVKQKIQTFDADQTRFIFDPLDKHVVKIQGLSGTGKTELLLHKLKELYQQSDKCKIFVTCHNKILADTLHKRIPDFFNFMKVQTQIEWNNRLWCTNAWGSQGNPHSGLYRYICEFYHIQFLTYNYMTSFEHVCQNAISSIKRIYSDGNVPCAFDYIFVDECQDFKDSFIELCSLVTSKKVYLAGDIFQSIFSEHSGKDYQADYFLTKCYRTDPKTLMFAHALGLGLFENVRLRWLSEADWKACGYKCSVDNTKKYLTLKREHVRRFLDTDDRFSSIDLIGFEEDSIYTTLTRQIDIVLKQFPTATVEDFCVILLDTDQYVYQMANVIETEVYNHFNWTVNKAYETKQKKANTLLLSNRNNVKGLEYPFVICLSKKISSGYIYRNAIYTMLTRSFLKTILLLPIKGSGIAQGILDGYNEIMEKSEMTIKIPTNLEIEQIQERFQKAKNRRSQIEIVKSAIEALKLSQEDASRLEHAAMSFEWSDLQEDDIIINIKTLSNLV